jgi:hypothetical protein
MIHRYDPLLNHFREPIHFHRLVSCRAERIADLLGRQPRQPPIHSASTTGISRSACLYLLKYFLRNTLTKNGAVVRISKVTVSPFTARMNLERS